MDEETGVTAAELNSIKNSLGSILIPPNPIEFNDDIKLNSNYNDVSNSPRNNVIADEIDEERCVFLISTDKLYYLLLKYI